jgi:N-acetylmuramoyl-L-alanine amidase
MPAGARVALAAGMVVLAAACGGTPTAAPAPVPVPAPMSVGPTSPAASFPTAASPPAPSPTAAPVTRSPGPTPRATGSSPRATGTTTAARPPVVVLDPGHNGGNAAHPAEINRQVDAGNGTRKACNTTGTATGAGYPEHAFAWDVALRTRTVLRAAGVDVRLTRPDDAGVGPCVDVRGRYGNTQRADVVVAVHADGGPPGGSGFHVIEAARAPGGAAVAASGKRLALAVRAALRAGSGLDYADYVAGGDGLDVRDDLAGLNLSTRPTVLVEAGNMRNPGDAALLSSPAGRQRIAAALAAGILAHLGR